MTPKLTLIAGATVSATLLLAGCGGSTSGTQTVKALWYGKQTDGSIDQGITPVEVTANREGTQSSVSIDLSGMQDAETGAYWNAAAYSAAAVGTIGAAIDPRQATISFNVDESIDGPSAGGLLTVAVSSDLAGAQVADDKSMTGTIMPDGSLGPVGGIPAKIKAAAAAGIKTVVIPKGQRQSTDPETKRSVDVVAQGEDLGVEVIEAAGVAEAYQVLVGEVEAPPTADPGPLDAELAALLLTKSKTLLAKLQATSVSDSGNSLATERVTKSLEDAEAYAAKAVSESRAIEAYAAASESLQLANAWNDSIAAKASATKDLPATVARLRAQVDLTITDTRERIRRASESQATYVEQVPGLVDAICWGVDALNELNQVKTELESASSPADAAAAASSISIAQYDATEHLSTAVEGVLATGKTALADSAEAWEFVGGYANLLAQAAEANTKYAVQAGQSKAVSAQDQALSEVALQQWQAVSGTSGTPSEQAIRTASALSAFVSSSLLVMGIGAVSEAVNADVSTSNVAITLQETFDQQVDVATALGERQAQVIAGAQFDPSYSMWGNRWGGFLASQPQSVLIADQVRREGLSYQLYSNVQAKMLTALGRSGQ